MTKNIFAIKCSWAIWKYIYALKYDDNHQNIAD